MTRKAQAGLEHAVPKVMRGRRAQSSGLRAEQAACDALTRDGWQVLGRRVRTAAGEIDILAERDGLLAVVEVKHRKTLAQAVVSLSARQRARLMLAAEIVLGENQGWGQAGVRFDVIMVDGAFTVRRVIDAFRLEG